MIDRQNVILTGFMGTGKSTVGKLLAKALSFELVDTDLEIERRAGRSIAELFSHDGEPAFRSWEQEVSADLAKRDGMVIATGGRLMLDESNARALLARGGQVFCLAAPAGEIVRRVGGLVGERPLLNSSDPLVDVRRLLEERASAYAQFPQIPTGGRPPEAVARQIAAMLGQDVLTVTNPAGFYNVIVGDDLLERLRILAMLDGPFIVISDEHVGPLHSARIEGALAQFTMPAGEKHKTLQTAGRLLGQLVEAGLDRHGTIVALGGGVVCDVAGFVASTYMRGVDVVQCPTSLLAMVDASVGGKTGVDLPQGKNLVGAFKQPRAVLADMGTLTTLPASEFAAGMAEVIKAGLIGHPELFERCQLNSNARQPMSREELNGLVTDAIRVKRDVIEEDPFELGRRALLNLGHTFAHAIERVSQYQVAHGPAVAMGLMAAARLSADAGYCRPELVVDVKRALDAAGLPSSIPGSFPAQQIYLAMFSDKKKVGNRLRFVLLRDAGDVFLADEMPQAQVISAMIACGAGS